MPDLLYKTFRIRLLSQLKMGVWYPEALVLAATGSVGTPIHDAEAYLMKEEADLRALTLAKRGVDTQEA